MFNKLCTYFFPDNSKNDAISIFLKQTMNDWNNKSIYNDELFLDLIQLYVKHNIKFTMSDTSSEEMKYYCLGWYIYQLIDQDKTQMQ
jgi:hypothetical protein